MKGNFGGICIINKEDLEQYCGICLKDETDIIEGISFLYSIKQKNIYVINVTDGSHDSKCKDYYFDGKEGMYILYNKVSPNTKENFLIAYKKACKLESKCLSYSDFQKDTLILARAFVNQFITGASSFLNEQCFPEIMLSRSIYIGKHYCPVIEHIGFYQIVPNLYWLRYVIDLGVKVVQLRIKSKSVDEIEYQVSEGIRIASRNNVKLFINDYWKFAVKYEAYGLHIGQEDLRVVDFNEIFNAGLRVGISTHCYYELAIAKYLRPSYFAFGPIFHTVLKHMNFMPQGIDLLNYWVKHLNSKIVAIGGINLSNLDSVIESGVDGIAVISEVINSRFPDKTISKFLEKCKVI